MNKNGERVVIYNLINRCHHFMGFSFHRREQPVGRIFGPAGFPAGPFDVDFLLHELSTYWQESVRLNNHRPLSRSLPAI